MQLYRAKSPIVNKEISQLILEYTIKIIGQVHHEAHLAAMIVIKSGIWLDFSVKQVAGWYNVSRNHVFIQPISPGYGFAMCRSWSERLYINIKKECSCHEPAELVNNPVIRSTKKLMIVDVIVGHCCAHAVNPGHIIHSISCPKYPNKLRRM